MTPEEFLRDTEDCYGPCGRMCLSCPEAYYFREIKEMVETLVKDRDKYKRLATLYRPDADDKNYDGIIETFKK